MNAYAMLVPTHYNDGTPVEPDRLKSLESMLVSRFGGFTDLGAARGAWRDDSDGRIYYDSLTRYEIATDDIALLREIAETVARVLDQRSVYVAQVSSDVQFVANPDDTPAQ